MNSKELAKLLGVSPATVSMALNGKPGVSKETKELVLEAAKKHHVSARALSVASTRTICLIVFQRKETLLSFSTFMTEVQTGVEKTCAEAGYGFTTRLVFGIESLISCLSKLSRSDTAGVILLGTDMVEEDFRLFPKKNLPIVLLDNHAYSYPIDCVKIDNISSAFSAVNFLIRRRKAVPGYLRSSYELNNFYERKTGFEQALVYNGMSENSAVIHDLLPSIEGAYADMNALLKGGLKPASCYFADNDLIAIGAMQAMQSHGYRIPEDVALVGFDDIEMSAGTTPPLTTMHVPKYHFGAAAVKRLLTLIRDSSLFPIKIEMTANLVIRDSL